MILLDTDIAVDVVRQVPSAIQWLNAIAAETPAIAGFTNIELIAGCRSQAEQRKLTRTLTRFHVLWISIRGCQAALERYAELRLAHGIGAFDCLIAETALEHRLALHTFNIKHFQHVVGSQMIQPYTR